MIVIQGRSGKSQVLENLIRKEFRTNDVLIIDTAGVKWWSGIDWATHRIIDSLDMDIISAFEDSIDVFKDFDWIVFYVNADESSIDEFKSLDRKYPQNFIVTIQSSNGITSKYFI